MDYKGIKIKKIVLALCVALSLFATDKYELTIASGYAHLEGTQGIDDQKVIGLRLGQNLDPSWLSQIELGFDHTSKATFEDQNGKAKIEFKRLVMANYPQPLQIKLNGVLKIAMINLESKYADYNQF